MLAKKRISGFVIAKYNYLYLRDHGVNPPALSKGAKIIRSELVHWNKKDQAWFKCLLARSVVLVSEERPTYFLHIQKIKIKEELEEATLSYSEEPGESTIPNPSLRDRMLRDYIKGDKSVKLDPVRISEELGLNIQAVRVVVSYLNKENQPTR